MSTVLLDPGVRAFLEKPRTAYISTIDLDQFPHTVPVWFAVDGDDIIFSAQKSRARLKHIEVNPNGSVTIGGDMGDTEGYMLKGKFHIDESSDPSVRHRIVHRYMEGDAAEQMITHSEAGSCLMRFTPEKIIRVR